MMKRNRVSDMRAFSMMLILFGMLIAFPIGARAQDEAPAPEEKTADDADQASKNNIAGEFTPAKGFDIFKSERGSLNISVYGLFRYLNQLPGEQTFIDHLGRGRQVPWILFSGRVHDPAAVGLQGHRSRAYELDSGPGLLRRGNADGRSQEARPLRRSLLSLRRFQKEPVGVGRRGQLLPVRKPQLADQYVHHAHREELGGLDFRLLHGRPNRNDLFARDGLFALTLDDGGRGA